MSWLRKIFSFREQRSHRAAPEPDEEPSGDVVKPFLEHLEDLRGTLFKMAVTLVIGMIVAFLFRDDLMRLVKAPLDGMNVKLVEFDPIKPFMLSLKLAFYAGIVLCFPLLLWFAAEFVLPALTRREKRLLVPGIIIGFILFGCGVYVAYTFILPKTLHWFFGYSQEMGISVDQITASNHFGLVTHLSLACGLLCELPIIVIALSLLGIVSYGLLSATRPYAFTLILIIVAIISPTPDPVTFITLSIPVLAIYEVCIWIVWLIERNARNAQLRNK